ncbi:TIGR02099 family protein [Lysobacter sp. TY2-98]|uniref:YhdP family protein n=1 Tax=Lysobacter sp. TY2-98 TaxID=2290922 RepID=UPI000E20BDA4|nr:YhdP family protein [Lysobacter sp. TY2-98]AXK71561.1 TIGR02099 family protein [Lysobacter sp. TY2-98]
MIFRHAKRAHVGLGYVAAVAVLGFALLLGLVSLALPLLAQHPAQVKAWLEHRTQRPVSFTGLRTHWTKVGPLIELRGLRIGDGDRAVAVGDAELLASVYLGLLPGHAFTELRLRGLDLTLERADDGTWDVRGLPGQKDQKSGDPFGALDRLGELHVIDGRLAIVAPAYGVDTAIPRADLRLRVDGSRVRAGVRAWMRANAAPLDGVLDFDRDSGDGRAYVGAERVDLRDWAAVLHAGGVRVAGGVGSARAWAELRDERVVQVTGQGALSGVTLEGAPLDGAVPRVVFDRVDALGVWRVKGRAWTMTLPTLRVQQKKSGEVLDGLALAGGGRFDLAARHVDVAPLLQAAALTDRLPESTRRWIRAAAPGGLVDDARVSSTQGRTNVQARLASVGFDRVGTAPGLRGIAGRLAGDTDGVQLDFEPASTIRFIWPQAFGPDHLVHLTGRAAVWRDGPGWRLGTRALHIGGEGYSADVRGGLFWQGDGTRPFIDLAADVGPTAVPVAKRFWVRDVMAPKVVQWLDNGLIGGRVEHGRAVVVGDLDDWPFRHHEGTFEARGHIAGGIVKFLPDWPPAEGVDADVMFDGTGFDVAGGGRIGRVQLPVLKASIDDYSHGALVVEAHGTAEASQLLDVVRASGLRKLQPETIDALAASGPAKVDFGLELPLGRPEPLSIKGAVDLDGAMLSDRRWDLRFDDVHGRATYDLAGFTATDLDVRHDGQPGQLSLRVGDGHVRTPTNIVEGDVAANFDIDDLLKRAPEMSWLSPYVAGRSAWTVSVVVPKDVSRPGGAAHLQLRSTLAGTSLDLPAPLRKPAAQALPAFVDTPLPVGSGEVKVSLGNLVGVRARTIGSRTGVRVVLGSGTVDDAAPPSGIVATGRAAQLDALDWIAFARGGGTGSGDGLALQRIDVTTPRLNMLGGVFGETRLQVQPVAGNALSVRADGATLSGSLNVPDGNGPIAGRFARVYWKSAAAPAPAVAATTSAPRVAPMTPTARRPAPTRAPAATNAAVDPSKVPALAIDVDDLRIGAAQLGTARFRSHPNVAGMQLDQFTARGRGQRIDATGEWTGRTASRTHIDATVATDDFGALLDGFGLGGRLGGGKGDAHFDASWTGAPMDFALATLEGTLAVDVHNGRLLEVNPGAGRVLGLLSLAELPRRLTLDFGDFFAKGFSFNQLGGNVRFDGGLARSDDFGIKGPAADIRIRGAANMRAQTFDQTIEVHPKSGNLLTAVGAIAGGPVGAAIGAAAGAVMQKPLGQLGAKVYRVTGPWADPKVEVMTRDQTRAMALAKPPAG